MATVFGVGGAARAGLGMKRRTAGVQEFEIRRIPGSRAAYINAKASSAGKQGAGSSGEADDQDEESQPRLAIVVCISGWLLQEDDFERPWGVHPRSMKSQLDRFYRVHNQGNKSNIGDILASYEGHESLLCDRWVPGCSHLLQICASDTSHAGYTLPPCPTSHALQTSNVLP